MIKRMGEAGAVCRRRAWNGAEFHANLNSSKIEQAQRNFINAVLRRESGAGDLSGRIRQRAQAVLPQPETSRHLLRKNANRQQTIAGLRTEAGSKSHVTGADRACRAPTGVWS